MPFHFPELSPQKPVFGFTNQEIVSHCDIIADKTEHDKPPWEFSKK
jgi:hypothetical protein